MGVIVKIGHTPKIIVSVIAHMTRDYGIIIVKVTKDYGVIAGVGVHIFCGKNGVGYCMTEKRDRSPVCFRTCSAEVVRLTPNTCLFHPSNEQRRKQKSIRGNTSKRSKPI